LHANLRAPSVGRYALVHAAVGYPAGLTLAKDFLAVASDVAYGSASAYTQVDASTNSRIEVTSPGSTNSPLLLTDTTVSGNAVYTVFMLGGGNTAQGVMRRER
jgi:hypothetical protein